MSAVQAVVIAGGRGERLGGVIKADLRIGGRRLLDRVVGALGTVESPLMLSIGPRSDRLGLPAGTVAIADLAGTTEGPLAGLAAAVASLHARGIDRGLLVSVAVDTPFLPADFVARLKAGLGDARGAFASCGEQFYPPNAIWRIEALATLPERVLTDRAPPSLKALQRELGARAVEWAAPGGSDPFANLNTVGDLVALGQIARDREV